MEEMKGNERDIANKLHRQFGHPTPKTLIKIITNAGIDNKDLEKEIDTISQMCRTCLKHRRPFSRPVMNLTKCLVLTLKFGATIIS